MLIEDTGQTVSEDKGHEEDTDAKVDTQTMVENMTDDASCHETDVSNESDQNPEPVDSIQHTCEECNPCSTATCDNDSSAGGSSDTNVQQTAADELLKNAIDRIDRNVTETLLENFKQITIHNEEFFKNQQQIADSKISSEENNIIFNIANLFEKYLMLADYCKREDVSKETAVKRISSLEKDFMRMFEKIGVNVGTASIGDYTLDENIENRIYVEYVEKGSESQNKQISSLLDKHYYEYKRNVVKHQRVGMFGDEDRM